MALPLAPDVCFVGNGSDFLITPDDVLAVRPDIRLRGLLLPFANMLPSAGERMGLRDLVLARLSRDESEPSLSSL